MKADFSHLHNGSSLDCGFTASKREWVYQLAIKNVDPLLGQNFKKIQLHWHSHSSSTTHLNKHILQNASDWSGQFVDMHWEQLLPYLPSITDIKMGPLDIWYLSIILYHPFLIQLNKIHPEYNWTQNCLKWAMRGQSWKIFLNGENVLNLIAIE